MTLLEVQGLTTHFRTRSGLVEAVDGVSFSLTSGRTLGIVGESGCGKSVTALSILRLLPSHTAQVVAGRVQFNGRDLVTLPDRELEDVRGREIGMIFQDPLTSLNPTLTIGTHLVQTLRRHLPLGRRAATNRAVELLSEVRISSAGRRLGEYPHHLSGGMRQRVMIALAIACKPKLLIADEPTTALDVTVQAQILDLLGDLRREHEMAMIMITHDMGVIAETADDVAVMYAGQIVESAPVVELFERPEHPYTEALLGSLPKIEDAGIRHGRLVAIAGSPPELVSPPTGCRFAPRCRYAEFYDGCRDEPQTLREIRPGHSVRTSHPRSQREIHLDVRTARFKNL